MPRPTKKRAPAVDEKTVDPVDIRYLAPALDKGLDILEFLCAQPKAQTRGEINKALGRRPSEGYRMLERLVARGYVMRSLEGDRYAASLKLLLLAQQQQPLNRFLQQARSRMQAFAARAEQSCHLGMYEDGNIHVVAEVPSPGKMSLSIRPGAQVSLVDTGSGHVLLAFQTPERRAELLAAHQPLVGETAIATQELESRLKRVRAKGSWQGNSQHMNGVIDIAVPLLGPDGHAFAALTCPFVARIDQHISANVEETRALLLEAARELSMK